MGNDLTSSTAAIVSAGSAGVVSAIALLLIKWLVTTHTKKQDQVLERLDKIEQLIHDLKDETK